MVESLQSQRGRSYGDGQAQTSPATAAAVVAVTVQPADRGDTTSIEETIQEDVLADVSEDAAPSMPFMGMICEGHVQVQRGDAAVASSGVQLGE